MEQNSTNILPFKHISIATNEAVKYIEDRKSHKINPLKTRWKKFNRACGGGLEPGIVVTIAGASGTGKSAFVNTLETDLIDLNEGEDIVILSFSFEMLSYRQVGRKLSNKLKKTTSELYSAETDLSDSAIKEVKASADKIKQYPIYYVDTPGTIEMIESTIKSFSETIAKGKWLVVILDHALLVDGNDERRTISDLQKLFIKVKKLPLCTIIQLSQMNRNCESPERINNPTGHYPLRSDLFASDSIFHASDFVIAMSRPELLGLQTYGPSRWCVKNKVYMHYLKVREGMPCILEFDNGLQYGDLIESTSEVTTTITN